MPNRYIHTRFLLPAFACLLLLTGCKKLVDVGFSPTSISTDAAFSSNTKANSVLSGIYSLMMTADGSLKLTNGGMTVYAGMSSDELANYAGTTASDDYQFYTNTLLAGSAASVGTLWQPTYKIIFNANAAIEGIAASKYTQLDDSTRRQLTGEAKFIRAFCYFYLTNLYGDVPMPLVGDFNQTALLKKTPQADVYKQIVTDLLDAQSKMIAGYTSFGGERVRANKWAATALLARVYLYQGDWANAETQAGAVIGSSQYSLVTTLTNVFNKNSAESILQLQQNNTIRPWNATLEGTLLYPTLIWSQVPPADQASFLIPSNYAIFGYFFVPPYYFNYDFMKAFEAGDKRKTLWTDSTPSPSVAPYNGIPYYYPAKYTLSVGTANGAVTQYYTVLRLAEQYLVRAEARAQQGTNLSGAAADLNALRTRAGLANTTAATKTDLLAAVAHERQVELFAEWGHRWLDLKRTGRATAVLGAIAAKQPWSNHQLLYPIPVLDLTNDPNLVQNPGY